MTKYEAKIMQISTCISTASCPLPERLSAQLECSGRVWDKLLPQVEEEYLLLVNKTSTFVLHGSDKTEVILFNNWLTPSLLLILLDVYFIFILVIDLDDLLFKKMSFLK